MNHPALISRTFEPQPDGKVKVVEHWNHKHPECPFWISPHLRSQLAEDMSVECIVDEKFIPADQVTP